MTMRKANATGQKPDPPSRLLTGSSLTLSAGIRASPDLHPAVDDDVDARDVRALIGGKEQREVRDVFRLTQTAQERPFDHRASESACAVFEMGSVRPTLNQARRDRVDTNAVLAPFHRELARHPDDRCLVRGV